MLEANYFGRTIKLNEITAKYGGSFLSSLEVYEADKVQLIVDYLSKRNNPVLIDVGACTGSYSLLPLIIDGLIVHSFEPSKAFDVLKNNIELNGISDKVFLNRKAVSNEKKIGLFNEIISDDDSCIALSMLGGVPAEHKKYKSFSIEVETLDNYCKDIQVDAIKIDTEGNELNVLKGAAKTILRDKPFIMFEYSDENASQYGYNHSECITLLNDLGYECQNKGNDVVASWVNKNEFR